MRSWLLSFDMFGVILLSQTLAAEGGTLWKTRINQAMSKPASKSLCGFCAQTYAKVACYYLRIWVENVGKTRAERVQVYASKLLRRSADGLFKEVEAFLPMNLRWSHGQQASGGPEIFAEGISPGMGKHCDFGHVLDPQFRKAVGHNLPGVATDQTILVLDLEVPPATLSHLVPPGEYRLELRVAAANCAPVTKAIELTITGKWFEDQNQMFLDGLGFNATEE
jgi:hypothetical protein